MNCWFLSWRRSPWWTIAKNHAMQAWLKKLRRRWIQRCWRDWLQPQVAKSSKLAIRNSLGGKKYAKISKKTPWPLLFPFVATGWSSATRWPNRCPCGCGKNGWGDGKISRKTWWDPMGWISWRLLRQWDLTNLLRSRGSKPAAGMLQKCGWPGDWVCCWRFFVGVVEISESCECLVWKKLFLGLSWVMDSNGTGQVNLTTYHSLFDLSHFPPVCEELVRMCSFMRQMMSRKKRTVSF